VVIPALNEESSIGRVIGDIPDIVDYIVVADNGSIDATAERAQRAGAVVVDEPERGYGAACLRALDQLAERDPDIIVFLDGDGSDYPGEMALLCDPIIDGTADLVIGSRMIHPASRRHLPPASRFGNALASAIIQLWTPARFTDLGPFRAITRDALGRLQMADRNYGWTVEMQLKAGLIGLRCAEVPVSYRARTAGRSKVSGSVTGSCKAGAKILWTLVRHAGFTDPRRES
ncbi:MAG: glycosyltransferase, partial [candidate division Zixibacteria bacterium]|nr:glycosyltransferase [candidate division Zixibacteria bacterium]